MSVTFAEGRLDRTGGSHPPELETLPLIGRRRRLIRIQFQGIFVSLGG